ncbi:MAG: thioredoxin domain-containing protein, partial [Candidatus Nanoarchaeia archaeon]
MSKPYNPFRAASLSNALRLVSLICLSAIILMAILYFSIKDNRQDFISWLGFKKVNLEQTNMVEEKDNLGLSDTTVVNNSLRVRELDRSDNLWGEIDAPVNLIVYVDFECPFCAQFNEV